MYGNVRKKLCLKFHLNMHSLFPLFSLSFLFVAFKTFFSSFLWKNFSIFFFSSFCPVHDTVACSQNYWVKYQKQMIVVNKSKIKYNCTYHLFWTKLAWFRFSARISRWSSVNLTWHFLNPSFSFQVNSHKKCFFVDLVTIFLGKTFCQNILIFFHLMHETEIPTKYFFFPFFCFFETKSFTFDEWLKKALLEIRFNGCQRK
jgi:hypothetical protein